MWFLRHVYLVNSFDFEVHNTEKKPNVPVLETDTGTSKQKRIIKRMNYYNLGYDIIIHIWVQKKDLCKEAAPWVEEVSWTPAPNKPL